MTAFGYGAATDVGQVRSSNQDRFLADGSIFVVADGMGGHLGGEIAAGIAVDTLREGAEVGTLTDLVALVHAANDTIVETAKDDPSLRGMGTTLTALVDLGEVDGEPRLGIANIGDSRLYVLTESGLVQLTEDHSLVESLVRDGRLTREEAASHPQRNVLTRALGIDPKVLVDGWELRAVRGSRFVICSDGLFNEIADAHIVAALRSAEDPELAARDLVDGAVRAGGHDNVTVVVVDVLDGLAPSDDSLVLDVRRAIPSVVDEGGDKRGSSSDDSSEPTASGTLPSRIRAWRLWLITAVVIIAVTIIGTAVAAYARSYYFVGVDGGDVVIYQGRPGGTLWFDPTVEEPVNLGVAELSTSDATVVISGVEFDDVDDARDYGRELALRSREPS